MNFNNLLPDFFIDRVEDIDLGHLKSLGYSSIIFDLDNTLVGWRTKDIKDGVIDWLKYAKSQGFNMCIVSNCMFKNRVRYFGELLGIPFIFRAVKPRKKAFLEAVKILGSSVAKTAVVGDQVFTDVFGGNRIGFLTILVPPIDKREFYATLLQRTAEKIILSVMRKKGLLKSFTGAIVPSKKKQNKSKEKS